MTGLEIQLNRKAIELQCGAHRLWAGREREAVIEIVRAADQAACIATFSQSGAPRDEHYFILKGAPFALATFLPDMRNQGRGLPFGPSNLELAGFVDQMLLEFGQLAALQRLASLERYGLARSRCIDSETVEIIARSDTAEEQDRSANRWLSNKMQRQLRTGQSARAGAKRIARLLDQTSAVDREWFIRYDGHTNLSKHFRHAAMVEIVGCLESEALPDTAPIGGRSFAEWRETCAASLGGLFNHIAYALRLLHNNPNLMLRNLLTVPVLRSDAAKVWLERGERPERVDATIARFTLDAETIVPWLALFEVPAPYYVDVGGGWLLLCSFGALLNPIHGLVRSLRAQHRKEWDAAVAGREDRYRSDLSKLFPPKRFTVPNKGFVLKREDGSHLTDVDAVVADCKTGSLALVQLKWPDAVGLSLAERESRRRNLLDANDWIDRVSAWIGRRNSREIAHALGIPIAQSSKPALLFVLPRYGARFTANDRYDNRAAWLCWPEVVHFMSKGPADPLAEMAAKFKGGGAFPAPVQTTPSTYRLRNLNVIVRVE